MRSAFHYILLFPLFLTLTLLVYSPTLHARFVFDFIDWYNAYHKLGWAGLIHSFNDPSLHHVYHFFFFIMVKIFGLNEKAWYFVFCALHAANAFLLLTFLYRWLHFYEFKYTKQAAFFAALLFLLSPYQTEVVVWGATIHYLLVLFCGLLCLNSLLLFLESGSKKFVPLILLVYAAGLFTHEIIFVIPVIGLVLVFFHPANSGNRIQPTSALVKVILPQFLLIGLYFLLNKIALGKWIAHYGADTHLRFDWFDLLSAYVRYSGKYFLYAQFLTAENKNCVYGLAEQKTFTLICAVVVLLFFAASFLKRKNSELVSVSVLLMAALLALFPVLNLYFPYWINIHADRLGYFASAFLYAFVSVAIFSLLRKAGVVATITLCVVSLYYLNVNTSSWQNAAQLMSKLEQSFPADTAKHYYILNLPDSYEGAYMFRSLGDSKLAKRIHMQTGIDRTPQITEVLAYNLKTNMDSVRVTTLSPNEIKVQLSNSGSWWWRYTVGATDYETEKLKVDIDDKNASYVVTFKSRTVNDVYLYQTGAEWRVFNQPLQ